MNIKLFLQIGKFNCNNQQVCDFYLQLFVHEVTQILIRKANFS